MTIRKLAAQPASRRILWYARLLDTLIRSFRPDTPFAPEQIVLPTGSLRTGELLRLVRKDVAGTPNADRSAERLLRLLTGSGETASILRAADELKHAIADDYGLRDSDITAARYRSETADRMGGRCFRDTVVLAEDVRSPYNVGSIIRSSEAFGVERCILAGTTVDPAHPRLLRAAMGAECVLPVQRSSDLEADLPEIPVFALETGGVPVQRFEFPDRGVVLVGNEEFGLSERALELARSSAGLVSLQMYGSKQSLNVANALTAILSWWTVRLAGHGVCVPRQDYRSEFR